jgi:hypothetical protein
MVCSSTSNSSYSSEGTPELKLVSPNPSTTSILGDILFIDNKGYLRRVLNILDPISCKKAGIKPLKLTHDLKDYIKKTEHAPLNDVFVQISPGGTFQNLAPDQFAKYIRISVSANIQYFRLPTRVGNNNFRSP